MYQNIVIVGYLGGDPEMRTTASGKPVCNFSVATSEKWGTGEARQERTEWHRVVAFDAMAENAGKYLSKGSLVLVEGRLNTDKWTDKEGITRYTVQIFASKIQYIRTDRSGNGGGEGAADDGGRPTSGRPTSGRPTSGRPTSGRPTSGRPTSGRTGGRNKEEHAPYSETDDDIPF